MTTGVASVGSDPSRLLADARALARRVRVAQRVTWLPLLVLAGVTLGSIPVYLVSRPVTGSCHAVDGGELCRIWEPVADTYWLVATVAAYAAIARGYLRVVYARGLGSRVLPYMVAGGGLAVAMFAAVAFGAGAWIVRDPQQLLDPSLFVRVLFRLLTPTGAIGLALLVLAWLERHVALLLFALGYLAVVLAPVRFGWLGHWGGVWADGPQLVVNGAVLLLGSAAFALAQRSPTARTETTQPRAAG
ncbi:hypothetical protein O7635_03150 [Asanoa sp. WMMD1127]|uniref:hypothetical protein n=1 Tax=Asanoa sp. WMMD1127 TaxID=3016107 RepID=UPI002416D140|nr:hypothetical protein [Asanoa sp. WMMD1127]MDG4820849.1 hypothetical protein [Asanoa sp. WMMD1127]